MRIFGHDFAAQNDRNNTHVVRGAPFTAKAWHAPHYASAHAALWFDGQSLAVQKPGTTMAEAVAAVEGTVVALTTIAREPFTTYSVQHAGDDQLLEWYRLVVDEMSERKRLRAILAEARGSDGADSKRETGPVPARRVV